MKVVKPAVCSQLKSPASAQFPVDLISITGNEENGYEVSGFVDSQNGYGAMIRNDFTAFVAVRNGVPTAERVTVAAKANAQRAKEFGVNYIAITIFTIVGGALLSLIISMLVGF